jgi:hypothetical protein
LKSAGRADWLPRQTADRTPTLRRRTPSYPGYCLYYAGRRHMAASLRAFVHLAREVVSRYRAKAF